MMYTSMDFVTPNLEIIHQPPGNFMRNIFYQHPAVCVFLVLLLAGAGCNALDHSTDTPTTPVVLEMPSHIEFGPAISTQLKTFNPIGALHVNLPEPNDYQLTYETTSGAEKLVFRLLKPALLTVRLSADEVVRQATLQRGTISLNTEESSGYAQICSNNAFQRSLTSPPLILVQDQVVVYPTPTPAPQPTPLPDFPPPAPASEQPDGPLTVIAAVGDSITYGDGSFYGGYPDLLERKFWNHGDNVVVHNKGVPGECSASTNARFERAISGMDVVLLMIGTNDLGCASCTPIDNIAAMLDQALESGVVPLVSTIPPQYDCYVNWDAHIRNLNAQIYRIAAERQVRVVDNYNAIWDNGGSTLFSDCVHFNDWGYDVIADQWYRAIRSESLLPY